MCDLHLGSWASVQSLLCKLIWGLILDLCKTERLQMTSGKHGAAVHRSCYWNTKYKPHRQRWRKKVCHCSPVTTIIQQSLFMSRPVSDSAQNSTETKTGHLLLLQHWNNIYNSDPPDSDKHSQVLIIWLSYWLPVDLPTLPKVLQTCL